jgi:DsbC/DsbD-like thiol-disulfide interchange protein
MTQRFIYGLVAVAAFLMLLVADDVRGQGLKKSDGVVKVSATADKPDADGKQTVTIVLAHDAGWHTYANPVGLEDLASAQTSVTVSAKEKPDEVKVEYPAGKLVKDKVVGDYKVYEDKVTIKAAVKRAKGDVSPLEVTVKFQACTDKQCLLPAAVKLTVAEK